VTILAAAERHPKLAILLWIAAVRREHLAGRLWIRLNHRRRHEMQPGLRQRISHGRQRVQKCYHRFDIVVAENVGGPATRSGDVATWIAEGGTRRGLRRNMRQAGAGPRQEHR